MESCLVKVLRFPHLSIQFFIEFSLLVSVLGGRFAASEEAEHLVPLSLGMLVVILCLPWEDRWPAVTSRVFVIMYWAAKLSEILICDD